MYFLPEEIKYILQSLTACGYSAHLVGGCVRDMLMGKTPHDYDVTTSALPEQTASCFCKHRIIKTGIKHGTITVLVNDMPFEITTYRIDGQYRDNRHPESVSFTSAIEYDLARRDFTINALAMDISGNITDLFNGRDDIANRIMRAVGSPDMRFCEDGLRILRALRFSAALDFGIEHETSKSIHKNRKLLKNISAERIQSEFFKLLCGNGAARILRDYNDVIRIFLPCIQKNEDCEKLASLPKDIPLRLAWLLKHMDSDAAKASLQKLKASTNVICDTLFFLDHIHLFDNTDDIAIRLALSKHEPCRLYRLLSFIQVLSDRDMSKVREHMECIVKSSEPYRISQLAIKGDDLLSLGISGRDIGTTLEKLLLDIIHGNISNKREELLQAAALYNGR